MGRKAISNTFSVTTIEDGKRGKVGRFFYYAGTFNPQDNDPTHVFEVNDAQAPYFEHTENGQKRYHVFNYETNGSYTMAQMWAISSNWNNKPWESMTNDFKYLITEALFSNFAHLGSAIISGDWMISQYGTIFDAQDEEHEIDSTSATYANYTYENAYTLFDSAYPNESKPNELNFAPYYAIDLKRGTSYLNKINAMGTFRTGSRTSGMLIGSNLLQLIGRESTNNNSFIVELFDLRRIVNESDNLADTRIILGDSSKSWVEIHSNKTVGNENTSCIWLQHAKGSTRKGVIITPFGVNLVDFEGSITTSKTWDELLS